MKSVSFGFINRDIQCQLAQAKEIMAAAQMLRGIARNDLVIGDVILRLVNATSALADNATATGKATINALEALKSAA